MSSSLRPSRSTRSSHSTSSLSSSRSSSSITDTSEADRFLVHLGLGTEWATFKMPSDAPPNYDVLLALICEQWLLPISPKPLVRIVDFYRAGRGDGASATCSTVIDGHYQWQRALDKLEASKDTAMGPSPLIELTKRGVGKGWMVVRVEPAEAAAEKFDLIGYFTARAKPGAPVVPFDVDIVLNRETRSIRLSSIPLWEDFADLVRTTFDLHPALSLSTSSIDLRRFAHRTSAGQSEFYHSTPVVAGREGERWIAAVVSALMWRSPRQEDEHHPDKGFFTRLCISMSVAPTMHVTLDSRTLPLTFEKVPTLLQTKLKIKQAFDLFGPLNLVLHDIFFVPDESGAIQLAETVTNEMAWRTQVVEAGSLTTGILALVVENRPPESRLPSRVDTWRSNIEHLTPPNLTRSATFPSTCPRSISPSSPTSSSSDSMGVATFASPTRVKSLSASDIVGLAISVPHRSPPASPSRSPSLRPRPSFKITEAETETIEEEEEQALQEEKAEVKKAWARVLMERRATFKFATSTH